MYFANSTEGDVLQQQCDDCVLGQGMCPVMCVQGLHNYSQIGNKDLRSAMSMLVDDKGVCQVRKQLKVLEPEKPSILEYLEKTR